MDLQFLQHRPPDRSSLFLLLPSAQTRGLEVGIGQLQKRIGKLIG